MFVRAKADDLNRHAAGFANSDDHQFSDYRLTGVVPPNVLASNTRGKGFEAGL